MIARYTRPEMAAIWSEEAKFLSWLEVEIAVCRHFARTGVIPRKDWASLHGKLERLARVGGPSPRRIEAIERKTRHDVIAFTTAVAEKVGPLSRWVHFGLTSSDVVDTALSMRAVSSGRILLRGVDALVVALSARARAWKNVPCIGRTHGMFAEPTSLGLKFLGFKEEWVRNRERLERAVEGLSTGKLSGAVGASPHLNPSEETRILKELGLKREPVSTQVLPRDRHAEFFTVLAICGSSLERLAVELRHLQRSEVGELQEGFARGQKGSSAMPHKRNPISAENLTGIARLLRAYAQAALENIALWHERDISHSSVERVIFPDATQALDYALDRMARLVAGLELRYDRVEGNLRAAGETVYSGHLLLELVRSGVTREKAYAWVQQCALRSWDERTSFLKLASQHPEILKALGSASRVESIVSQKHALRSVDRIFAGVRR